MIVQVVERVRPHRPDGHGEAWRSLLGEEERIKEWVKQDLKVVKIGILLGRRGVVVPHRTLARFAVERCGAGRRSTTVRVDEPSPGVELQVDFGRLGLVAEGERRRVCWALIFTACFSRHCFAWPTFNQTTEEVIGGFEAAWVYFGGSSGNVCFAGASYRPGSKFRRRQVQVAVIGDQLEMSIGEPLIRRHPIKHDRTREHGALANPGGRPPRTNAA